MAEPNPTDTEFPQKPSGFLLNFKSINILPLSKDPGRVLVRWELQPTNTDLSDYEFYIDRGDAQDQIPRFQHVTIDGLPWRSTHKSETTHSVNEFQIAGPINGLDFYEFVDNTTLLRNLYKLYFYRIRIRRISTQEEISSAPVTWHGDLDLEGIYVVDEHNFLLEDTTGVPALIYKKRRSGVLCDVCYDPIQKKRLNSHCMHCFATNWIGGYHKPVDAFIDFSPEPDLTMVKEWGEIQPGEVDVFLTNYPLFHTGDMIIGLREGKRYRVTRIRRTEKRGVPMLQFLRVAEINPADVEYKFPVNEEFIKTKIDQFEAYKKRREF